MDLYVSFFGLVYSRSVFETCLNICYWCMNNTAIYNLFLGKKTGRCHQERQSACLPGDCVCFSSLQGQNKSKKSPSFTIFQGEEVFLMCYWAKQSLPRRAWASPKPGSWGSSCFSLWVLKPSLIIWTCAFWWKCAVLPPCIVISATCLKAALLAHGLLMSGLLNAGGELELWSKFACASNVLFSS